MALEGNFREIYQILRRGATEEYKKALPELRGRLAERLGMGAPAIGRMELEEQGKLQRGLMGQRAGLLGQQLGREQQLEDVAGERQFERAQTLQDWFKRFEMQRTQQRGLMERQQLAGTQATERMKLQREYQLEARDYAKDQRSKGILKQLLMTGANILTGGIAGALTEGVGFGTGLLAGGTGMAQMGAYRGMMGFLGGGQDQMGLSSGMLGYGQPFDPMAMFRRQQPGREAAVTF